MDAQAAMSMAADLESDAPAFSSAPSSPVARSAPRLPPFVLDTGACPFVGRFPDAAAYSLRLEGGAKTVAIEPAEVE